MPKSTVKFKYTLGEIVILNNLELRVIGLHMRENGAIRYELQVGRNHSYYAEESELKPKIVEN